MQKHRASPLIKIVHEMVVSSAWSRHAQNAICSMSQDASEPLHVTIHSCQKRLFLHRCNLHHCLEVFRASDQQYVSPQYVVHHQQGRYEAGRLQERTVAAGCPPTSAVRVAVWYVCCFFSVRRAEGLVGKASLLASFPRRAFVVVPRAYQCHRLHASWDQGSKDVVLTIKTFKDKKNPHCEHCFEFRERKGSQELRG